MCAAARALGSIDVRRVSLWVARRAAGHPAKWVAAIALLVVTGLNLASSACRRLRRGEKAGDQIRTGERALRVVRHTTSLDPWLGAMIDVDSVDDRRIPVVSREWSRFALNAFLMLIFDQEILA